MKKYIIPILIALSLTVSASFQTLPPDAFNQPSKISQFFSKVWECKWRISCYKQDKEQDKELGAFSTLSSTDNINAFPTLWNESILKMVEVGTTSVASITTLGGLTSASSLATVGTITTGTWSADAIAVGKGGTGTTTPSLYRVLLGNAANGITVASSTGTSGQVFASNGEGSYPSFQSITTDAASEYQWTGNHNFRATTTIKNLTASSTIANPIYLNGVNYNTPSAQGASSTVLINNGSGGLSWYGTGSNGSTTVYATAGTYTWTRPAGVTKVKVTLVGGGGGSGGCGGSCTGSSGGGGAAGVAMAYVGVSADVIVVVGAGGTAGSTAGGNGGNGADTTFAGNKTITSTGGLLSTGSNSGSDTAGGAGSGCTNADFCFTGQDGVTGSDANYNGDGSGKQGGQGGSTGMGFGIGGRVGMSAGTGNGAGFGYGAGGGGTATAGQAGSAGQAGLAIIEWY